MGRKKKNTLYLFFLHDHIGCDAKNLKRKLSLTTLKLATHREVQSHYVLSKLAILELLTRFLHTEIVFET